MDVNWEFPLGKQRVGICGTAMDVDREFPLGSREWEEWLLSDLLLPSQKYLHESRHRHAMARKRGEGGRFFSPKEKDSPHMQVSGAGANPLQDTHHSWLCC